MFESFLHRKRCYPKASDRTDPEHPTGNIGPKDIETFVVEGMCPKQAFSDVWHILCYPENHLKVKDFNRK